MSVAMALGHQHHSIQQSDLEVLDALTTMPSTRAVSRNGRADSDFASFGVEPTKRRPLDTLQALRRPPIDPIVLAATLSSGPHVTRHHFLHSFGPKVESKQMTRSQRAAEKKREEEAPASSASATTKTRARAGSYANCDSEDRTPLQDVQDIIRSIEEENEQGHHSRPSQYPSKQAPRSERLRSEQAAREEAERKRQKQIEEAKTVTPAQATDRPDLSRMPSVQLDQELAVRKQRIAEQQERSHQKQIQQKQKVSLHPPTPAKGVQSSPLEPVASSSSFSSIVRPPPLTVRCYARTRIPTPHGEIFCHLYRNNRDQKEHLALVVDPAQNAPNDEFVERPGKMIRSRTLDEVWGPTETEMERIVRGAYVGRLGPTFQEASLPQTQDQTSSLASSGDVEAPLVRIHSECYTGETIGSQRCDCGEQLDEAIRLIHSDARPAKGVVVYLRQEGRGIGLLDKLMAYNLQDMGHDTVAANILLGHLADARKYDIAAEILRDLGVDSCRLLTNNPEKMEALEAEGVRVAKRVPMVPRIWRLHSHAKSYRRRKQKQRKGRTHKKLPLDASIISQFDSEGGHGHSGPGSGAQTGVTTDNDDEYDDDEDVDSDDSHDSYLNHVQRRSGATLIGGSVTRGPELEKYLRTKVERMGHLLELPKDDAAEVGADEAREHAALAKTESDADTAPLTDEEPLLNEQYLRTVASNDARDDAHSAHTGDEDGEEILVTKS